MYIRYLEFLLSCGYIVTHVHRVMTFTESPYMKPWVQKCTRERAAARSRGDETGAQFWKLAANAVYGKFIGTYT